MRDGGKTSSGGKDREESCSRYLVWRNNCKSIRWFVDAFKEMQLPLFIPTHPHPHPHPTPKQERRVNQDALLLVYPYSWIHCWMLKGKGKFHPRTGHEGPEGGRGIALLFLWPQYRMGWVVNATPRPLYPREIDPVPIV
jgi:hypothetical protein